MIERDLTSKKQNYHGIDFFKLIASILVIWLHATETANPIAVGLQFVFTRFCVPFFFICSGFFFCSRLNTVTDSKSYFWHYQKRLLRLFLFWGVLISGPIAVRAYIINNPDVGILRMILLSIRRVFIVGYGAYWYLLALMLTSAFFYICWKKEWEWMLITAMIIGQLLQIGYSSFQGVINSIPFWRQINSLFYFIFSWDSNFIMAGIPLFGIGWLICKYRISLSKKVALGGFIVFSLLRLVEFVISKITANPFWAENSFSIIYIPQAVMFFFIALQCQGIPRHSHTFRRLSTSIYLTHWIIMYNVLSPIMLYVGVPIYEAWFIPGKVLATLLGCLVLDWLLKKTQIKTIYQLIGG